MGKQKQKKIKNKLNEPTKEELVIKFNNCSCFSYLIIYLIEKVNENTFSFISGIIANIPISILLSLTAIKFENSYYGIGYIISLAISIVFSIILLIASCKFAIRHIEINKIADRGLNEEIYNNLLCELCFKNLNYLKRQLRICIVFFILLLCSLALTITFFNLK